MPEFSVLIVNWNTRDLADQAIGSLYDHEDPATFEVILVDNASRDGSAQYLASRHPNIRIIANSQNVGFARANNQAAAAANGRYLLLLNSDAYLTRPVLAECLDAVRRAGNCILGCRILNPDGSLQLSAERFPTLGTYLAEAVNRSGRAARIKLAWQAELRREINPVDWLTGAFLMVEREIYLRLGGLNEEIFMYGEDMELCHRAARAGVPSVYVPGPSIVHLGGKSIDHTSLRSLILTDTGRLKTFATLRGRRQAMALRAVFFARSAARALAGSRVHGLGALVLLGLLDARRFI